MRPRVIRWHFGAGNAAREACLSWLTSKRATVSTPLGCLWLVNWRRWDG